MDGIMILDTICTPIYSFGWNNWCFIFFIPALIAIYLILFGYVNRRFSQSRKWILIGLLMLIICVAFSLGICSVENVEYDTTYQVILNNEVDIEQFRANYEIIDQVGITYIIRQR